MPTKAQESSKAKIPPELSRLEETLGVKLLSGKPYAGGFGDAIATVGEHEPHIIEINDPAKFAQGPKQTKAHEMVHLWRNQLPGPIIKAALPDNPNNPYDLSQLDYWRKQGRTLATIPQEAAAYLVQKWTADPASRKNLQPWINDLNTIPLSVEEPTSPNDKEINMRIRPPIPPASESRFMETKIITPDPKTDTSQAGQPDWSKAKPIVDSGPTAATTKTEPVNTAPVNTTETPQVDWSKAKPITGNESSPSSPPETGFIDKLQSGFDKATEVQPHNLRSLLPGKNGQFNAGAYGKELKTAAGNFGGGVIGLASPIFHPLNFAEGAFRSAPVIAAYQAINHHYDPNSQGSLYGEMGQMSKQPLENLESLLPQALAAIAGGFEAPEAGKSIAKLVPSSDRAGALLGNIEKDAAAKGVLVSPNNTWPALERFQELTKRGGSTSKPTTQLSNRLQNLIRQPDLGAFGFPEARDFYSNISRQSSEELSRLNPKMRTQMGAVRSGLNEDLTNAAKTINRGVDYAKAMKEYARAQKLNDLGSKLVKYVLPKVGYGAGAWAGYEGLKSLFGGK